MTDDPLDEGIRQLGLTSERLISAVGDMSKRLNTTERMAADLAKQQAELAQQQNAMQRQGKINGWLALSLVLDVVLSLALAYAATRIDHNSDRIEAVQERTSREALCPLYGLFLRSVENPRPDQIDTAEKRALFEQAARTIRDGWSSLGCTTEDVR